MKMRIEQGKPLNLNDQLNAIGKGLLPTPDTRGFTNKGSLSLLADSAGSAEECGMAYRVSTKKKQEIWATPTANDAKNSLTDSQAGRGTLTANIVERKMFPTPTTTRPHDSENTAGKYMPGQKQKDLTSIVADGGGQLNPDWVEALMGYPYGWTDIEKYATYETNYPAAWINGTWEDNIPRVISAIKNRVNRLKCLGNAIVPQCAELIYSLPVFDRFRI